MNGLPSPLAAGPEGLRPGGGERVRVRGKSSNHHPSPSQRLYEPAATLILPHQGGGKFFRELDAPQLPPGQRPSGPAAAAGYFTVENGLFLNLHLPVTMELHI